MIDAYEALLKSEPTIRISVAAVAKAAAIAAPTFYLYFKDTDEILLELSRRSIKDTALLISILNEEWPIAQISARSMEFVEAFYVYWRRNREVLGLRNLQADLGVSAFNAVRREAAMPIVDAIAGRIKATHTSDLSRDEAISRAIIIYAAMERLAARPATLQLQSNNIGDEALMKAEAYILTLLFAPDVDRDLPSDIIPEPEGN